MALLVNCLNISTNTSYITLNLFKIQEVILQEQSMDSVDERYDIPFKIKKSTIVKLVPSTLELKKNHKVDTTPATMTRVVLSGAE